MEDNGSIRVAPAPAQASTGVRLITERKVAGSVSQGTPACPTLRGKDMPAKWQQWMPFRIDAFKASPAVQAMHPAARMGYLYLLSYAWQTEDCTVPSDPMELAEKSGLGDELWAVHGPRIMRKFEPLNGTGKLRNSVCFEEWEKARQVYIKRSESADRTNSGRSPSRLLPENSTVTAVKEDGHRSDTAHDHVYVSVPVNVPVNVRDSVDTRILSESVGIFDMKAEADMHRLLAVHMKESQMTVDEAIEHMISRWVQYQQLMPSLEWSYGSSYKFFMSGNWDKPETWPRITSGVKMSNPGAISQRELTEAEAYAMWQGMPEEYRQRNPWGGKRQA